MIRYLDSGHGGPDECLGLWLDGELTADIRSFRGQFGFYDGAAIRKYTPNLAAMLARGGTLRLVIGANGGDPPTTDDLTALLPLLANGDRARLTVVGFGNALFHPKTLHLVRANGQAVAVVGSANLTAKGLGHNVEAGVVLESAAQTDAAVQRIAQAIDRWGTCGDGGVHQVRTAADIEALRTLGLVVTPGARRRLRSRQQAQAAPGGRGTRARGWQPPPGAAPAADLPEGEGAGEAAPAAPAAAGEAPAPAPAAPAAIAQRWAKLLKRSDAQQVPAGTNPTGKLRLGQARFPIDQETWFREVLFGDQEWVASERRGVTYEEVHVPFHVSRHGDPWVPMTLKLDHGAHRVADQNNVPTVLSWGPELGSWLRENNQIGNWVAIEKDVNGDYWLSIQATKPAWAP